MTVSTTTGVRTTLPGTAARLEQEVDAGLWLRGAQVCAVHDGRVHCLSVGDDGTDRPVTDETIFKIYCAIKPVTAIAIAKLVEAGAVGLDEPLAPLLPHHPALAEHGITLRHVLSHTAGLHTVMTSRLEVLPPARRAERIRETRPPPGWSVGQDSGYSDYVGWYVLGALIERLTDEPLRQHLRRAVLEPLGMRDTWIGMTAEEFDANADRLGMSWHLEGVSATPMLLELSERWCCEVNAANGGYSCARDLATFYASLVVQLRDGASGALPSSETLATFCSAARPRSRDVVFGSDCTHALGFTVDLSARLGGCPPGSAFGHAGLGGGTFGFGDPVHGLGLGVVTNGIIDTAASVLRRHAIVQAVYDDLGIDDG